MSDDPQPTPEEGQPKLPQEGSGFPPQGSGFPPQRSGLAHEGTASSDDLRVPEGLALEASLELDDLAFLSRLKQAAGVVDRQAPADLAWKVLEHIEPELEEHLVPGALIDEPWWAAVRRSPWLRLAAASLALHLIGAPVLAYMLWWAPEKQPQVSLSFVPTQALPFEDPSAPTGNDESRPGTLPELTPAELQRWERGANRARLDGLRLTEFTPPTSVGVRGPLEGWIQARLEGGPAPELAGTEQSTLRRSLSALAQLEWELDQQARGRGPQPAGIEDPTALLDGSPAGSGVESGVGSAQRASLEHLLDRAERRRLRYAGETVTGQPPSDELWDPRAWLLDVAPLLDDSELQREPWLSWLRWARE